jgi:hypothetical protein
MKTRFRLTPPQQGATPFEARVEFGPDETTVSSNRSGEWADDPKLKLEDLLMPEQGPLYDWDVEGIGEDWKAEGNKATPTDDGFLPTRDSRSVRRVPRAR